MVSYDTQESKQAIYAIVAEQSSTDVIAQPDDSDIAYESAGSVISHVFLIGATNVSRDASKTINRTDLVGTQLQRVTEGSVQLSLSLDLLALRPAALGDTTVKFASGTVHGLNAATNAQYALTTHGADKLINSTNTVTIRVFQDCDLDANEDADVTSAKQVIDYVKCHVSGVSFSIPGGGDVSVTFNLDAEKVAFPSTYNAAAST